MARLSFEEGRKEIVSLLQAGKEEFDNGNRLHALLILFEAHCALGEMFQSQMEEVEHGSEFFSVNAGSKLIH